jgi:hypothetical protein
MSRSLLTSLVDTRACTMKERIITRPSHQRDGVGGDATPANYALLG